jgi:hypothetical protein
MKPRIRSLAWMGALLLLLASTAAQAANDPCSEWQAEQTYWKARVLQLYLSGAPQRPLDEALFELMQREAYLTSCPDPVEVQRAERVGWRLVGRAPDEYGSAVAESVLEQAGFPVDLRRLFDAEAWPDRTRMAER